MNVLAFKLPYPPSSLSPNAREHWGARARVFKKYKGTCYWECIAWGVNRFRAERHTLALEFHPPNARRRDLDNAIAAFKAGQDAIARALGIDDSEILMVYPKTFHPPDEKKAGYVICRLSVAE